MNRTLFLALLLTMSACSTSPKCGSRLECFRLEVEALVEWADLGEYEVVKRARKTAAAASAMREAAEELNE